MTYQQSFSNYSTCVGTATPNQQMNVSRISSIGSFSSNNSVPGEKSKRYRHNPYSSESSTPNMTPMPSPQQFPYISFADGSLGLENAGQGTPNVHQSTLLPMTSGHSYPGYPHPLLQNNQQYLHVSQKSPGNFNLYDRQSDDSFGNGPITPTHHQIHIREFQHCVGNIYNTALTSRGRHILVNALRTEHPDVVNGTFSEVASNFATLSVDPQGTHVARALIDCISADQAQIIISYLTNEQIIEMSSLSQHTRRIIQSMCERFRSNIMDPIISTIANAVMTLSQTQQGCITVMRALENCLPHQKALLVSKIRPVLATLTMDPYANYVAQAFLDATAPEDINDIVHVAFVGHWLKLSTNKYASNVMEKVVRGVSGKTREVLISELCNLDSLKVIVNDGFGNFVLQAIIDSCKSQEELISVAENIKPVLAQSPYAHRIDQRIRTGLAMFSGVYSQSNRKVDQSGGHHHSNNHRNNLDQCGHQKSQRSRNQISNQYNDNIMFHENAHNPGQYQDNGGQGGPRRRSTYYNQNRSTKR
eukprot:Tbor_TRINITY_DN5529_c1_g10::TRINITY_DN5529_c1_g10_i1::g.12954::m.12954